MYDPADDQDAIGIFCDRHPIHEAVEVCRDCGGGCCVDCWTMEHGSVLCLNCASNRLRRRRLIRRFMAGAGIVAMLLLALAAADFIRYGTSGSEIRSLRTHLAQHPRDIRARLALAALFIHTGHRDHALAEYRQILEFDPYSERAHGNIGILLYDAGDLDGAAYHLATSVDIDPTYYDAHRYLAVIYERQLALEDAIYAWRKAMELAPSRDKRVECAHALARNLERVGRKFEAAEVLYGLVPWTTEEDRVRIRQRIARLRDEADAGEPLLAAEAVEVRFRPRGPVIPVRGLLNDRIPASFIVDTGATFTTITSKLAEDIGIEDLETRTQVQFRTANGEVTSAALVQVRSLQIADAYVEDLTVAVCDSCSDGLIDGLLGLNFLQRFSVEIDGTSGRLVLRRPPKPARSPAPTPAETP